MLNIQFVYINVTNTMVSNCTKKVNVGHRELLNLAVCLL